MLQYGTARTVAASTMCVIRSQVRVFSVLPQQRRLHLHPLSPGMALTAAPRATEQQSWPVILPTTHPLSCQICCPCLLLPFLAILSSEFPFHFPPPASPTQPISINDSCSLLLLQAHLYSHRQSGHHSSTVSPFPAKRWSCLIRRAALRTDW